MAKSIPKTLSKLNKIVPIEDFRYFNPIFCRVKLIAVLKNILINRYLQEAEHLKSIAETEEYTLRLKVNEIPVLSAFIADINEVQDKRISDWFLIRRYKSEKAADFIKARKKEIRKCLYRRNLS